MKTTIVSCIEVDYNDLDESITEFLKNKGRDDQYECVAYEEWGNYESHDFDIDGDVNEDDKKRILTGDLHFQTSSILNWMAEEGIIEKGNYKIDIFW